MITPKHTQYFFHDCHANDIGHRSCSVCGHFETLHCQRGQSSVRHCLYEFLGWGASSIHSILSTVISCCKHRKRLDRVFSSARYSRNVTASLNPHRPVHRCRVKWCPFAESQICWVSPRVCSCCCCQLLLLWNTLLPKDHYRRRWFS